MTTRPLWSTSQKVLSSVHLCLDIYRKPLSSKSCWIRSKNSL